jgi:hypothetical protein
MNIIQLKAKYDDKAISEIEAVAKTASATQESQHKEFIGVLFYLENTKRFRENDQFKKSTFGEYVRAFYGMAIHTYNHYRFAYFRFPVESEKYGVGPVMKTVKNCGSETAPMVFKAIEAERKPSTAKVNEIIEKYAKRRLKKRSSRPSYSELERELVAEKKKRAEDQKTIKAQAEQLQRQAKAIENYKAILGNLAKGISPEILRSVGYQPVA